MIRCPFFILHFSLSKAPAAGGERVVRSRLYPFKRTCPRAFPAPIIFNSSFFIFHWRRLLSSCGSPPPPMRRTASSRERSCAPAAGGERVARSRPYPFKRTPPRICRLFLIFHTEFRPFSVRSRIVCLRFVGRNRSRRCGGTPATALFAGLRMPQSDRRAHFSHSERRFSRE